MNEAHQFDRRNSDPNVAALSVRVTGLERRMQSVEMQQAANNRELAANTALTKQVHSAVELISQNTADIIEATKWLSTSKKIAVGGSAVVGAIAGAIAAVAAVGKAMGFW
jgi:hypothetical protein